MTNANGPWNVSTEGDVEGRTMVRLGTYSGTLDRVALGLADRAYYVLTIEPVKIIDALTLPIVKREVYVQHDRLGAPIAELLAGRPVSFEDGNYYHSTRIVPGAMYEPEISRSLAESAKRKLTRAELTALLNERDLP